MKRLSLKFIVLVGALVGMNCVFSDYLRLFHIGEDAELFRQWQRVNENYTLLTGPIEYLEEDSELFTRGYRATSTHDLTGEVVRQIFDYPIEQSPLNIFQQVQLSLKAQGYQEVFSCSLNGCGEVEGWQLYLSQWIGEQMNHQYYLAARKHVEGDSKINYVAFYVNDIDGQARAMIDMVSEPNHHRFDVVVQAKEMARTLEKDGRVSVHGILFEFNSAVLKKESEESIKSLSEIIKENSKDKFAIVGHTDNLGDFRYNEQLSRKRALAVKKALIDKFGVKAQQVEASGVGSLSPLTSNTDDTGRALNRRVELVKIVPPVKTM